MIHISKSFILNGVERAFVATEDGSVYGVTLDEAGTVKEYVFLEKRPTFGEAWEVSDAASQEHYEQQEEELS